MFDNWSGWCDWIKLPDVDWNEIPTGPGTYMIAARHTLRRAVEDDPEGILDIGMSKSLRNRLNQFCRCAGDRDRTGHMAGWRYARYNMNQHFPLDTLYICWRIAATTEEAAREEGRLIEEYVKQHMESPPLNYSASWRHIGDSKDEAAKEDYGDL